MRALRHLSQSRRVCYVCWRPAGLCYCDALEKQHNATKVIIVQHPRERQHPLGTARIVLEGLCNVELVLPERGQLPASLRTRGFPPGSALLYPSQPARDLATLEAQARPSTLVVLDGTWHHVKTLFRDHGLLRELPQFYIQPERPTEYRVRREPRSDYVSTVEAVTRALEILEPGVSYAGLLRPFRRMIDLHLEHRGESADQPRQRRRRSARRGLPRALAEDFGRAVLVYGEPLPARLRERDPEAPRLCSWTAKRLSDGQLFAELIRPRAPLPGSYLEHMRLCPTSLDQGSTLAELQRRWRAFLRHDDIVMAWNDTCLRLMRELATPPPAHISLKSVYRGLRNGQPRSGSLRDVVQRERLPYSDLPVMGRAAERLAQTEALAHYLRRVSS